MRAAARVAIAGGGHPPSPGPTGSRWCDYQGETLGALSVAKRPGETLTPVEGKLMSDLAAQAGLVLHNIGLTEQLRARLAELQASRLRIVTAPTTSGGGSSATSTTAPSSNCWPSPTRWPLARVAGRPGPGAGTGTGRPAQGRDQRRAGDPARTRPRHLPAAARRPGPARRHPRPGRQGTRAGRGEHRRHGPLPGRRSRPPSTSAAWKHCTTPPGTRRDRRCGSAWPTPGTAPSSR